MKFSFLFFSFLFLFSLSLVSALDGFGFDDAELPKLNREDPVVAAPVNYSIVGVNSSDYWDNLDYPNSTQMQDSGGGVLSIIPSWLTSFGNDLWCRLTGCNMTGPINMTGNNITNVNWVYADNVNVSKDLYVSGESLWIGGVKFSAVGDIIYINGTINVQTINVTTDVSGIYELTVVNNITIQNDVWCNATNCYTLQDFLVGNVTDTQKNTNGFYLYNDTTTIFFNETQLNNTIDARATGDNSSWNQSFADTLYADIIWGYNQSEATRDMWNETWSSTYNVTYHNYVTANISNSTTWWYNMNSINTTQMENNGGILNILESWLTTFFGDTQKTTNGFYLHNDTTTIYFNETQLNNTIISLGDNTYLNLSGTNANQNIDISPFNFTTTGWFLPYHFRATTYHSTGINIPFNFYDDGTNIVMNMSSVGDEFSIETDNSKIKLFNEPKIANDFKVFQVFSKEASDVTEFVVTKAGDGHASYFVRSLAITGNSTNIPTPFNCSTYANHIDCKTDVTGADFYVQDDVEINGSLFVADSFIVNDLGNVNMSYKNITDVDCIIFNSGGRICGG